VSGASSQGRYHVESQVGGGAMGEVYRAIEKATGRPVAIKVLRESARDVDRVRFKREIKILAELRHP